LVGDTATALPSLYCLYVARRLKAGRWVQVRILGNMALDYLIGIIPIVGDLLDVGFKSNERNARLVLESYDKHRRADMGGQ
jgi:hypothetical protein